MEALLEASGSAPVIEEEAPRVSADPPASAAEGPLEELPVLTVRDTGDLSGRHCCRSPWAARVPLHSCRHSARTARWPLISQLDPRVDTPGPDDLYEVGTLCVMHKAIRVPKDNLLLFCDGMERIRTRGFTATEPFLKARVERIPDVDPETTPEIEALRHNVIGLFQQIVAGTPNLSEDLASNAGQMTEPKPPGGFRRRQCALRSRPWNVSTCLSSPTARCA